MTYRVGKTYRILAMLIGGPPVAVEGGDTVTVPEYEGFTGWLPLLNDFQQDDDFIHERRYHAHIDYRFLSDRWFRHFERVRGLSGGRLFQDVITFPEEYLRGAHREFRQMECHRTFESLDYSPAYWIPPLESKYGCAALKNGKCPHRGTPRAAFMERNGELVCPAHGLKWDRRGALSPWSAAS